METKYYVLYGKRKCYCCGSEVDDKLYIGKDKIGEPFIFQEYKRLGLSSFKDWKDFLDNTTTGNIFDDYNCRIFRKDFYNCRISRKDFYNLVTQIRDLYRIKDRDTLPNTLFLDNEGFTIERDKYV